MTTDKNNCQDMLQAMFEDINLSYPSKLDRSLVQPYIRDAVLQLYNKGYCKEQYWMKKAINMDNSEQIIDAMLADKCYDTACPNKINNVCPLHNLHCQFPDCEK